MNDREKSPGAPDAQIPPPRHPKFEHLPKRFFSQMFRQALRTYPLTGCPINSAGVMVEILREIPLNKLYQSAIIRLCGFKISMILYVNRMYSLFM